MIGSPVHGCPKSLECGFLHRLRCGVQTGTSRERVSGDEMLRNEIDDFKRDIVQTAWWRTF